MTKIMVKTIQTSLYDITTFNRKESLPSKATIVVILLLDIYIFIYIYNPDDPIRNIFQIKNYLIILIQN